MRNPDRISRVLTLQQKIWEYQPDVRFNQLLSNLQHIYSQQNNHYGRRNVLVADGANHVQSSHLDLFYLEVDKWESFLLDYLLALEGERQIEINKIDSSTIDEVVKLFRIDENNDEVNNELFRGKIRFFLVKEARHLEIEAIIALLKKFPAEDRMKIYKYIQENC